MFNNFHSYGQFIRLLWLKRAKEHLSFLFSLACKWLSNCQSSWLHWFFYTASSSVSYFICMQLSYTHTGETKTEKNHISPYLQIIREDSVLEQSYLRYLFYNSSKWLGGPMCSELYVFIRQSLLPKVYSLAYETHIKKSQRTEKEAKRQIDIWWGLSGFVGAPLPLLFFQSGFLIKIPKESQKLQVKAHSEQAHLSVLGLQNRMD